jgi:RNA polymerase sigma factor (sigma-70 family)
MASLNADLETRPSLLMRVRDVADREAWDRFVNVYGRVIFGDCRRRGLSTTDAEDVAQNVFAKLLNGMKKFDYDPERGRFRDWLGTVVRSEVSRFFRKNHIEKNAPEGMLDNQAADPGYDELFHATIWAIALETCEPIFEPVTWKAFQMLWVDHIPAPEVAAQLKMPIDRVYAAKSRILQRLTATVHELTEDWPVIG